MGERNVEAGAHPRHLDGGGARGARYVLRDAWLEPDVRDPLLEPGARRRGPGRREAEGDDGAVPPRGRRHGDRGPRGQCARAPPGARRRRPPARWRGGLRELRQDAPRRDGVRAAHHVPSRARGRALAHDRQRRGDPERARPPRAPREVGLRLQERAVLGLGRPQAARRSRARSGRGLEHRSPRLDVGRGPQPRPRLDRDDGGHGPPQAEGASRRGKRGGCRRR